MSSTSFHQNLVIGLRQSPGIEIVGEGVVFPRYYPLHQQLNRGSFHAIPITGF